jgi:hypothetical protein
MELAYSKGLVEAIDLHIVKHFSPVASKKIVREIQFTPTTATQSVYTPSSGKALRIKFILISSDTDVWLNFYWDTTWFMSVYAPGKGTVAMNLTDCNPQGPVGKTLYVQSSAEATVHMNIWGDEV